ncbi:uncharacterized protein HMPREF1541_01694 [Cyphellophora europaea CBS 101466]|uniref:TauD/TfdA-like domain-containing protein n=1 Tax=Cyphellophora europaea (strain CBS 101466) TaxID=1220924 RepID=W2S1I1_CYPE1|nr:uncharacterized protein HMPREF1541_01694 [Cyphellophora europaea CBS 101466]ETN42537.1 hypothetical protein HMPREF1541_01694 [Cyphellophora europaea CBS 101466]
MPHATEPTYKHISVTPIGPTIGAEVSGVDFSKPVPDEVFREILSAITKYGVLVFRHAALDDRRHVAFARQFGELDDVKPYIAAGRKNRFDFDELFDVSNLEDDGSLVAVDSKRDHLSRGNSIFHVDSSFNPRRAGFSLLRAAALPPPGHGGNTDFADTRTAYDELPSALRSQLQRHDYVGAHSIWHSRKKAAPPDSPWLKDVEPRDFPMGRHRLCQVHEASGRGNLYVAGHLHHLEVEDEGVEGGWREVEAEEGTRLIEELLAWVEQERYRISVEWKEVGDLVVWDNTCVMHRAGPGTFAGKYMRDMRRCTVHDSSSLAWGLNEKSDKRMGLP